MTPTMSRHCNQVREMGRAAQSSNAHTTVALSGQPIRMPITILKLSADDSRVNDSSLVFWPSLLLCFEIGS